MEVDILHAVVPTSAADIVEIHFIHPLHHLSAANPTHQDLAPITKSTDPASAEDRVPMAAQIIVDTHAQSTTDEETCEE